MEKDFKKLENQLRIFIYIGGVATGFLIGYLVSYLIFLSINMD